MKYIIAFSLLLMFNCCYSQKESVTAYYHRAKGINHILLLECNVGYSYSGPHLLIDEVFSYELKEDTIIRTFDTEYSMFQRVATLIINKESLIDIDRLFFRRVSPKRRDELIKKYIQPSADAGFYKVFLQRIITCQDD